MNATPSKEKRHRPLTRAFVIFASLVVLMASARDVSANCAGGGSTQTVTWATNATASGNALNSAISGSTAPCTLTVTSGTYIAPFGTFVITSGITVRSQSGAAGTILQSNGTGTRAVEISPSGSSCPSGATLEGFTLEAPNGGVYVAGQAAGCPASQVTNVTLRNLIVNSATTPTNGHGLLFVGVQNSVIDSCTIVRAYANGIFLAANSNNNIVMNSTIQQAQTQHAIAVQTSNDNTIVGNTIAGGPFFDGIILNSNVGLAGPGSSRNRIERNTIGGHSVDAVVLTDASLANYVGLNTAVSGSYTAPNSSLNPGGFAGVGVWVNNASNGAYVYGNDLSGSAENGIDVLRSKSTYLHGNYVHGNYQGGIWIANAPNDATIHPSAPVPQDTTAHANFVAFNRFNGQFFFQGTINSNAAYNYLSGAQGGTVNGQVTTAIRVQSATNTSVYENMISEVGSRVFIDDQGGAATTGAVFFRNKFLKGTNVPNPPQTDGRNGVTYALTPSTWDGGSFLGGNHWSDHAAANGNPDPSHPYTAFIGNSGGGPNIDRYPFSSETLEMSPIPNSVTVYEPALGSVLAAGTKKTIRWVGRGCALVDIYYGVGGSLTLIAQGYPNTGTFIWGVPAVTVGPNYFVRVVCANSNGGGLGLFADGPTVRVAWKKAASIANVNVFVKSGTGAETAFGPFAGTFGDIVLPGSVSNSSQVKIRIQNASSAQDQDSVDGTFMVRGAAGVITTVLSPQMQVGSIRPLEWVGPSNSYTVDLDLVGGVTASIVRNLPDFGNYTWFVPDTPAAGVTLRLTFKDANGNSLGSQVTSGTFGISRNAPNGSPLSGGPRRDFDADSKAEIFVYRPSNGSWLVRYSSLGYSTSTIGNFQWGVSGDQPIVADFDGDGRTDLTAYRPSNGTWYIRFSSFGYNVANYAEYQWGLSGDIPLAADWDGDGKTDLTVYRPSNGRWYIRYSSFAYNVANYAEYQWGLSGDIPMAGDFDGDRRTDLAVYRPSNGTWYIRYSSLAYNAAYYAQYQWGLNGDVPLIADFDGDGKTELSVYRPSEGGWFIRYSSLGYSTSSYGYFQWGISGDQPMTADFDGDARTELAVFRPSTGEWYIRYSSQAYSYAGYAVYQWGLSGDTPVK